MLEHADCERWEFGLHSRKDADCERQEFGLHSKKDAICERQEFASCRLATSQPVVGVVAWRTPQVEDSDEMEKAKTGSVRG